MTNIDTTIDTPIHTTKSRRGFASMAPERRRLIASQAGMLSHESGKAHQFTSEEARQAGHKGGTRVSHGEAGRRHMAELGRKGGRTPRLRHQQPPPPALAPEPPATLPASLTEERYENPA